MTEPRDEPFAVWAPRPSEVSLHAHGATLPMRRLDGDWWVPAEPVSATPGTRYGYLVDGVGPVPDPRSRWQPDGVHELSAVPQPTPSPVAPTWGGRPIAGGIIYELHVGTFTPAGTLDAAIDRLDHLQSLGVTHVELMPVNGFNGDRGWGYDGVAWFAVHEPYGGPSAYRRFVRAAHDRGLAVVQDVVYNHFGPSGNYLPVFGPYLADADGPWGAHVNLANAEVRRLILDNARFWLDDMGVDALRLDAVHALHDDGPVHILEELATAVAALAAHAGRTMELIAESDLNDPTLITPREAGGYGLDAQWSDDFHHALHVALTGETEGYYADFAPLAALAKVLGGGFFHDGTYSSFRGRDHGAPIDTTRSPSWRLVVSDENHDQVGNRAVGDRPSDVLDDSRVLIGALLALAGPFTPMLFQGEEWAASTPFQFFSSHPEPELGAATSAGRLAEFARMGWDEQVVPDPQDPATFARSVLRWDEARTGRHARVLAGYRALGNLRRTVPALTDPNYLANEVWFDEDSRRLTLTRRGGTGPTAVIVLNLGNEAWEWTSPAPATVAFRTHEGVHVADGAVTLPAGSGALVLMVAA